MSKDKNYYSEENMFDKIKGETEKMLGKFKFLGSFTAIAIFLLLVFLF